jgi:glucokinase
MFLGIEIGGTKLQLGLGEGDGALKGLWRGNVDVVAGAEGIRQQITAAVPELLERSGVDRARVRGVGIGFGGPVDDNTRTVIKSHQIEGWDNFPLADWISELLGWPAVLGNDADVAGLAEALFGAGKGLSPIFYITIGSGIGGGLILDGEIYRGCGRGAAEIGHLNIYGVHFTRSGSATHYRGALEATASGWAIEEQAEGAIWSGKAKRSRSLLHEMVLGEGGLVTTQHVAQAAAQGDELANEILSESWRGLTDAICQMIALLCPRRIVIGGGVSLMGEELLFKPLRELVAANVFEPFADCYDIVPAALGQEVVVHGALALARKRLSG